HTLRSSTALVLLFMFLFFSHHAPPTDTYPLSLHDALPIFAPTAAYPLCWRPSSIAAATARPRAWPGFAPLPAASPRSRGSAASRSEEHTSELQSLTNLVCRLLLEKKKHITHTTTTACTVTS